MGLDLSSSLLRMAEELARKEGVEVELVLGDMREIDYQSEFDGVLSWDTSFGYFSDEEDEELLRHIAKALKVGGKLLLDLHHRDAYIRRHLGKHWERKGDYLVLEEVAFDALGSRLEVRGLLIDLRDGRVREYMNSFREYTLPELRRMLKGAGLAVQGIYGDFKPCEGTLSLECDSVQIVAIKPG